MDEIKSIVAKNISTLRVSAGMTQTELAEKLNYSDKSVSKWERGAAIPDVLILKNIADTFGVTVDYLLTVHDDTVVVPETVVKKHSHNRRTITAISVIGVWTLALFVFIIFWLMQKTLWIIFVCTVPASLITVLILHSVFERGRYNYFIISALVLSIVAMIYLIFYNKNWWQIFLLLIPAELIVFLCFKIKRAK